jgi:hypothetical protein
MRTVFEVEVFDGYGIDRFAVVSLNVRFAVTPFIDRYAVSSGSLFTHRV